MPLSLLHPALFGFGIAAVSIPILLHLLKRKRRPIEWGAMRFLEQAFRKRRRRLTIEQLILLILRCALLVLIALGVGSLMIGSGGGRTIPTTMVIVIDHSIGSALMVEGVRALDENKAFALRAMDALDGSRGDQVVLIGAGKPAHGLVMPESSDLGAVRRLIEGLEPTDSRLDLDGAMSLASQRSNDPSREVRRVLVIAGSGRGVVAGGDGGGVGSGSDRSAFGSFDRVIVRSPALDRIDNIGILDASPTRSLVTHSQVRLPMGVRVTLVRSGTLDQSQSIAKVFDQPGSLIGQRVIRWDEGVAQRDAVIAIDGRTIKAMGARTALVRVEIDNDANERENTRWVPLATRTTIRVGVIDQPDRGDRSESISPSRWVRAALSPDERFGISIVDIDAYRANEMITPDLDALVVLVPSVLDEPSWERIAQLNQSGMLVLFTPDADGASLEWLDRVDTLAPGMIAGQGVLVEPGSAMKLAPRNEAFAPGLLGGIGSEYDPLARAVNASRWVGLDAGEGGRATARFDDGSAMVLESAPLRGRGMVVVFAVGFDLEWTNLIARPMFVPMMQELVRQGVGNGSMAPSIVASERIPSPPWMISAHRITLGDRSENGSENAPGAFDIENSARAGVIAQLDAQGATRSLVIINPDAQGAVSDPIERDELARLIQAGLIRAGISGPEITWIERDTGPERNSAENQHSQSFLGVSDTGKSLSLGLLWGAGIIAMIELLLARLFTARLDETQTQGARG